jgi:hypothetical protein
MNKSSHPGLWRMKNRVYSLSKQQIQEKTYIESQPLFHWSIELVYQEEEEGDSDGPVAVP